MAFSEQEWNQAKLLFEAGKSLSFIVNETGISKGQISKKSKALGWQKETMKHLAKLDVQNTIMQNEINKKKETQTKQQRKLYENIFSEEYDKAKSLMRYNQQTQKAMDILEIALSTIQDDVDKDPYVAIEQIPNIIAIVKTQESGRMQEHGKTIAAEVVDEEDKPKTRKYIIRKDDDDE